MTKNTMIDELHFRKKIALAEFHALQTQLTTSPELEFENVDAFITACDRLEEISKRIESLSRAFDYLIRN